MSENFIKIVSGNRFINLFRYSVWYGNDQFIVVDETITHQNYNRFYPKDIKLFLFIENKTKIFYTILSLIYQVMLTLFILLSLHSGWIFFWGSLTLINVIFIYFNLRKGKTGRFYLSTDINFMQIKAITRKKQADKMINFSEPLILAAQRDMKFPQNDEIEDDVMEDSVLQNIQEEKGKLTVDMIPDPPKTFSKERLNILSYLLIVNIFLQVLSLFLPELQLFKFQLIPMFILSITGFVLIVMNIIKLQKVKKSIIARMAYTYLGFLMVLYFIYYMFFVFSLGLTAQTSGQFSFSESLISLSFNIHKSIFMRYTNIFLAFALAIIGFIGYIKLLVINRKNIIDEP